MGATGLEFASGSEISRQMACDEYWLACGDHPTDSAETLWWRIQQARRERLRRMDPNEMQYI